MNYFHTFLFNCSLSKFVQPFHNHYFSQCEPVSAADWSKDMRTCKILSAQSLNKWLVICSNRAESVTESFLNCLRRVGRPLGFNVDQPKM